MRATPILILLFSAALALADKKPPAAPVNINTATQEQLETLPGVGPSTARSILHYRLRSGPFRRLEDLLIIKGMSKKKLEELRPYLRVK